MIFNSIIIFICIKLRSVVILSTYTMSVGGIVVGVLIGIVVLIAIYLSFRKTISVTNALNAFSNSVELPQEPQEHLNAIAI